MKRTLIILSLAGAALSTFAQQRVSEVDASPAKRFYDTVHWERAFAGYYGVNPGVEPGVPDDEAEREVLGMIKDLIAQGTDASIQQAAAAIDTLISTKQAEGQNTSPMMLQIAGTLNQRLAQNESNDSARKRYISRARAYLSRAVDSNTGGFPNFLRAHKNLANLLFRNDESKAAKKHFLKAVELGDKDAVTYGLLGAIYMEEGNLVSAESALRNSMMINPEIIEFKQLLGNVLLQQERYNEAKEIFTELIRIKPNEVNFWNAQSNCFIALDMIDEATRNLEIVRFMGNANVPSLLLLGDVYINKEMINEATEAYIDAVKLEPTNNNLERFIRTAETLNNFAAYENSMEVVQTIKSAYEGKLGGEDSIELLSVESEINIALGKGEEAAKNLEELLAQDPFNSRALLSLADYFSSFSPDDASLSSTEKDLAISKSQQQAIIYYERAQNLDDDKARLRAYVGEAQLRVKRDELDQAADLLEEAQSILYQDSIQAYLNQIRAVIKSRTRS